MKKGIHKIVSMILAASLIIPSTAAFPTAVHAADTSIGTVHVSNEKSLRSYAEKKSTQGTIILDSDIKTSKSLNIYGDITLDLNGHKINRGLKKASSNGEVIQLNNKSKLTICDTSSEQEGMITGGYSSNGGGGIHIKGGSLILKSGKIHGNKSNEGGGGIYLAASGIAGDGSQLIMSGGEISNNSAVKGTLTKKHKGGAIYINYGSAAIKGGVIKDNKATGSGGAIYANRGGIIRSNTPLNISGGTFSGNSAEEGGAIYIQDGQATIGTATFESNTASSKGGAIYCNDRGGTHIFSSTFRKNEANEGGAIFVSANNVRLGSLTIEENKSSNGALVQYGNDTYYSGRMVVRNNLDKKGNLDETKNIHLKKFTSYPKMLVTSTFLSGSELHVYRDDASKNAVIATLSDGCLPKDCNKYFHISNSGYCTAIDRNGSADTLILKKKSDQEDTDTSADQDPVIDTDTDTDSAPSDEPDIPSLPDRNLDPNPIMGETTTTKAYDLQVNGTDYPVYRAEFYAPSHKNSAEDLKEIAYYSDGYFMQDAHIYNEHLASMSLSLAMAAFNSNYGAWNTRSRNIKRLYEDLDFQDIRTNDGYDVQPTRNTIGIAMAHRKLEDGSTLIAVALRGTNYDSEWASNVTIGTSGEAKGFLDATDQTMDMIVTYLNSHLLNPSDVKFWVTGYSRTGAVSNMVAKKLIDAYNSDGSRVYAYCNAPANGGTESELVEGNDYSGIHNIINATDIVPWVATYEMGFIRYGTDHNVPGNPEAGESIPESHESTDLSAANPRSAYDNTRYLVGSDEYDHQQELMEKQLTQIESDLKFKDTFEWATFDYLNPSSNAPYRIGTPKVFSGAYQEEYIRYLMKFLQTKVLKSRTNPSMSVREYYSANTNFFEDENGNADASFGCSIEEALARVMELWRKELTSDQMKALKGKFKYALSWLSLQEKADFYNTEIRNYFKNDMGTNEGYANIFYSLIKSNVLDNDNLNLSEEAKEIFRSVWPVLYDFLVRFAYADYHTDFKITGSSSSQCNVVLGTLMQNKDRIGEAHTPHVNYAWVRSYDSFYTGTYNYQAPEKEETLTVDTASDSVENVDTPAAETEENDSFTEDAAITELTFTMDEPFAGLALPDKILTACASADDDSKTELPKKLVSVSWTEEDTVADYNKAYTGILQLSLDDVNEFIPDFTIADDTIITVNELPAADMIIDQENGLLEIHCNFENTAERPEDLELMSIIVPEDQILTETISSEDLYYYLPSYLEAVLEDGSTSKVSVEWQIPDDLPDEIPEGETITLQGTVILPEYITAPEETEMSVSICLVYKSIQQPAENE